MRVLLTLLLCIAVSVPALAGPPADGTYTSTDIGGNMLPGRYSESWYPGKLSVNNTLNEQSWDGAALGTQWHWYCPWIVTPPSLLVNTVDANGNGNKIWSVSYTGGYCWLDGAGPWAGGDPAYTANVTTWSSIVTETYANFQEVGTIRNNSAAATFNGYTDQCMSLSISNVEKTGDSNGGPLAPGYPDFWYWSPCASLGPQHEGEWGDVDSITFSVFGCTPLRVETKTWGDVKAMYRN